MAKGTPFDGRTSCVYLRFGPHEQSDKATYLSGNGHDAYAKISDARSVSFWHRAGPLQNALMQHLYENTHDVMREEAS